MKNTPAAPRNVTELGQVFTPNFIADKMLALRQNTGGILEPSCGDGAFLSKLESNAVGVEIDRRFAAADRRIIAADFFNFSPTNKFATIIGNPPYVRFQDIGAATKPLLNAARFDRRSNLYLFFIDKCLEHLTPGGELIFITPRDFLKATSARNLNARLYAEGSITHFYELGDAKIFPGFSPNCAIWRWEKGRKSRRVVLQNGAGKFNCANGQIWFGKKAGFCLGDYFSIKVGAVSGADDVFCNKGNLPMVCSYTAKTGRLKRVIYNEKHRSLYPHKARLLRRKIRAFDESNWWEWGRKFFAQGGGRIYVNAKTRNPKPFFASDVAAYDGSVLALFPKTNLDLADAAKTLNDGVDWRALGFVCDNRFLFTQRSLEKAAVAF